MARLLVAEDDPAVVEFLRRALPRLGWEADFVATGEGLLREWRAWRPDAVLSDVGLAGALDGIAAISEILQDDPAAAGRAFLMTGDEAEAERARAVGLRVAFLKPFVLDELEEWLADRARAL